MPSRIDTVGHTKAFDYPVMDRGGGGEVKLLRHKADSNRSTVEHAIHQTTYYIWNLKVHNEL